MSGKMSVDALSDSELRSKLAEYGYPVGPVTQTTRKILAKKLKNLIEARASKPSRHSLAARYSSDETDDDASNAAIMKKKKQTTTTRRQTLATTMPPPSTTLVPSDVINALKSADKTPMVDTKVENTINFVNRKSVQKKFSKSYVSTENDLETGSDSDVGEPRVRSYVPMKTADMSGVSYDYKPKDHGMASQYVPEEKIYDQTFKATRNTKDDNIPKFNTTYTQPKEDMSKKDNKNQGDILSNYETPFLSEFARRLSSQSLNYPTSVKQNFKGSAPREVKEKDSNGHFSSLRSFYSTTNVSPRGVPISVDKSRENIAKAFKSPMDSREELRNNQNFVSRILVIVLALFFGGLAIIYLGLGNKTETIPSFSSDRDIPLCNMETHDFNTPGVHCVFKENIESVLKLLKELQPILTKKTVSVKCDGSNEKPYLTDEEIIRRFTNSKMNDLKVKENLHSAQLLVIKNPDWGISLVEINGEHQIVDTMDGLFSARINENLGMSVSNPQLPMQCHLKNKIFAILSTLLIGVFGIITVVGIQKLVKWYINYKKCTEREVFQLVSEIINMVEIHHQNASNTTSGSQDRFIAINHVRDNLIPPKNRKKMSSLWEKAVKFLDENESRIRREVQQVAGEEFQVWRWLHNNTLNTSSNQSSPGNKKTKVWQGQAFETMEGSVNSLSCSPTPCLKIRHMFDPDMEAEEDWETKVRDAILDKCGEEVKILHIRVDRNSREGCVYMKCFSQEDAGKAYRALHGCWFDGHLVTVKYLRLERYHERFPDAVRCSVPLKPSNNQRLSMQAHYWQTPMETN